MRLKDVGKILILLSTLGTLSGCVTMMSTGAQFDALGKARNNIKQAESAYNDDLRIYNELLKRSSTPKASPYPSLGAHLAAMKAPLQVMKSQDKPLEKLWYDFDKLAKNRGELRSDMPEWPENLKNRESTLASMAVLGPATKTFSDEANAFAADANSGGVLHIKTADFKNQFKANAGTIENAVKDSRGKIIAAREYFRGQTALTMGIVQHKEKQAALDTMEAILEKIEAMSNPLEIKIAAFLSSNIGEEVYSGPGIPKIGVVEELSEAIKKFQPLADQFNAEAAKLK